MKKTLQRIIQVLFLALFVFLIAKQKVQLWMALFVVSVLASFVFGRLYCGWACPINTVLGPITWMKKKLHIKSLPIPSFLAKTWVRILTLVLFITVFVFTMKTGKKLPVLPVLFGLGVFVTLFFPEEFWHRYLCPYGTILSLPSRTAKFHMTIDAEKCNNCNACSRVCPALAIGKSEKHFIKKQDCLTCMQCERVCKQKAISFKAER
jgi:polyferredoxin